MKIKLKHVRYMPKHLEPGVLYVSNEFCTAAHLCACGCGSKVRTPLTPTEWTLTVSDLGPSLKPSIGNWQLPCKSHYWIINGQISWSTQWSDEQILQGRRSEQQRRQMYHNRVQNNQHSIIEKLWQWIKNLF